MAIIKEKGGSNTAATVASDEKTTTAAYNETVESVRENTDSLQRHLGNRQIQMIAIGGSIGTALFVSIGNGLIDGGPGSLLLAYTIYTCLLGLVNNCMAEMTVFMPISGITLNSTAAFSLLLLFYGLLTTFRVPRKQRGWGKCGWAFAHFRAGSFIRFAGKWVDEAFGFMSGWNFYLYEAAMIPFEISAINLVLTFWRDDIPVAAVCAACVVLYGAINVFAVKYYGEVEFWLSTGKFLLILVVFCFTFITMVGGNPEHDAYGFRYWSHPGAFAEYIHSGTLGRFQGFLGALWSAAFTIVGPEYLAMVAGEAERPRVYLKQGFKTVYWRFGFFFIGGALCVGIIIPSNDPTLIANNSSGTAAGSPYVIAMQNFGIGVLPHITNALMITSIFSAGNAYTYCAMRSLYGLALEGQAPRIFAKCTRSGIPVYAFAVTMLFPLLSFLDVSSGTGQALTWFANLTEAAQLIDYIVMCVTYIFFYRALKTQGFDRTSLPYRGWFQPYSAWIGLVGETMVLGCYGYETFLPGEWDLGTFFSYYTMVFVAVVTYVGWKVLKGTRVVRPEEADLVWDRPVIDAYEEGLVTEPEGFWREVGKMVRFGSWGRRGSGEDEQPVGR